VGRGAVRLTFLSQLATIDVPALNDSFETPPLSLGAPALAIAIASVVCWGVEGEK
jgi:hypothetical protein